MESELKLINSLAHWLAKGKLESAVVLPALGTLSGESTPPVSLLELLQLVEEAGTRPELQILAGHVRKTLRKEALDAGREPWSWQDSCVARGSNRVGHGAAPPDRLMAGTDRALQ